MIRTVEHHDSQGSLAAWHVRLALAHPNAPSCHPRSPTSVDKERVRFELARWHAVESGCHAVDVAGQVVAAQVGLDGLACVVADDRDTSAGLMCGAKQILGSPRRPGSGRRGRLCVAAGVLLWLAQRLTAGIPQSSLRLYFERTGRLAQEARRLPRATAFLRHDSDHSARGSERGSATAPTQHATDHLGDLRALLAASGEPPGRHRRCAAGRCRAREPSLMCSRYSCGPLRRRSEGIWWSPGDLNP